MPDIFISYNREDRDRAGVIANALQAEGFSVWWDAALRAGETYDEVTERNLRTAGAVVVLWSKASANSKWVRAEATVGERSSTLVPALIEDCERPIRFELVQTADLRHWRGDRADPHWRAFMQDVRTAITRRSAKPQPAAASVTAAQDASFETTFWNSIKDGKDRSDFEAYLKRYPAGHFAALAQNRLAALVNSGGAQQTAPPAARRQRTAPAQRTAAPPPKPKKSGNGILVAGIVVGLCVIGGVAFMMTREKAEPATVADAPSSPADLADAEPAADPATDIGDDAVDGAEEAAVQTPLPEEIAAPAELAAAIVEPEVEAAEEASGAGAPFRDCEACPLMASLPGGSFMMGSPSSEPGRNAYEGPQREVAVKPFAIGVYEVTSGEWALCVADGACPAKRADETGKLPVLGVSWRDANAYASWLSKKSGRTYRLPTEAEWEYAARAGASTAYWWGDEFDRSRVSAREATAVGSFEANAFGLHDVLGNAREWVADCYVNNFTKAPVDGSAVTEGDCGKRVIRGGAWSSAPADMRTANRSRIDAGVSASYMGFRIAAEIN